ncbi:MAG: hypothetical protein ACYCPR_01970 [Thermoplasmataceae archaeon]
MSKVEYFESQSGVIRRSLSLDSRDEVVLSNIWPGSRIEIHQGRAFLDLLKDMGLVKGRIDSRSYPSKKMITLSENGKKVAEKFKEIKEIPGEGLN